MVDWRWVERVMRTQPCWQRWAMAEGGRKGGGAGGGRKSSGVVISGVGCGYAVGIYRFKSNIEYKCLSFVA